MFQQNKGISLKVDEGLSLSSKVNSIVISLDDHDLRIKRLEYKAIDLEAWSRRNNLLFGGIPEQKYEDCQSTIATFLKDHLHIDPCPVIPHTHRLGRYKRGNTRHIIVYFLDYRDVSYILENANKLKGTAYSINRDFPREIAYARRQLWPEYKDLEKSNTGKKVNIVYPAKIVMDGRIIKDNFPDWGPVLYNEIKQTSLNPTSRKGGVSTSTDPNQDNFTRATTSHNGTQTRSDNTSSTNNAPMHKSRRTQSPLPHPNRGRNHAPSRTSTSHSKQSDLQTGHSFQCPWTTDDSNPVNPHRTSLSQRHSQTVNHTNSNTH